MSPSSLTPDQELRLACLELALRTLGNPIRDAQRFYDFVATRETPHERILQAMEEAGVR